jgi:hypothetical protein
MIRVGIAHMMMVMALPMLVAAPMVMAVTVLVAVVVIMAGMGFASGAGERLAVGLAGPGAFGLTQLAALHQPLDVVVMAVLGRPHLMLETEHLGAVLAEGAIHVGVTA